MTKSFEGERGGKKEKKNPKTPKKTQPRQRLRAVGMNLNKRKEEKGKGKRGKGEIEEVFGAPGVAFWGVWNCQGDLGLGGIGREGGREKRGGRESSPRCSGFQRSFFGCREIPEGFWGHLGLVLGEIGRGEGREDLGQVLGRF